MKSHPGVQKKEGLPQTDNNSYTGGGGLQQTLLLKFTESAVTFTCDPEQESARGSPEER